MGSRRKLQLIDDENDVSVLSSLDEDEYVVEKIFSHRRKANGEYQYFLKWSGYPDEESTWENESNIYSKELIQEYWNKRGGKPNSSQGFHRQESNNRTRRRNNPITTNNYTHDSDHLNEKTTTNCQISIDNNGKMKRRSSDDNAMEVERKSLFLRSNQRYYRLRRRRRGDDHFEETKGNEDDDYVNNEFCGENDDDNYGNGSHIKTVQGSQIIRNSVSTINTRITRDNDNNRSIVTTSNNEKLTHWGVDGLKEMDSWEEYIESVDYVSLEEKTNEILIFVTWKFGFKSVHASTVANFKCPQKVIAFYEKYVRIPS